MEEVKEFITSHLAHYASAYYNPQEAHDYYLRNRELKGRNEGDLKTKDKKETWNFAEKNIDKAKKAEIQSTAEKQKAETERLRQTAQQKREQLQESIKKVIETLMAKQQEQVDKASIVLNDKLKDLATQRQAKLEKIAADVEVKIDRLPPLPKNASKSMKTKRLQDIAEIKGDAKTRAGQILQETRAEEGKARADAAAGVSDVSEEAANVKNSSNAEVQRIGSELKASVDQARTKYVALKAQVVAKYEAIYQSEFDAIKQNA